MYKLLIVDDEETIREGLRDIVDWKSMGFEVAETLEDGRQAMDYIARQTVDVILTDIKMTFVSGLDLANHVKLNYPHIKVAVISGYQEFELARQAMSCNVKHYLLKPTRLDELKRVFLELRSELDQERLESERLEKKDAEHNRLKFMLREQFFTDLIMGAIPDKREVDRRLKAVGLTLDPSNCKICVVNLYLSYSGNKLPEDLEDDSGSLYEALRKYATSVEKNFYCFTNFDSFRNVKLLAVAPEATEDEALTSRVTAFIDRVAEKVKAVIGVTVNAQMERIYTSMYAMSVSFSPKSGPVQAGEERLEEVLNRGDYSHLARQQKLLLSYLKSQDSKMAQNVYENMLKELSLMDLKVIRNWMLSLFAAISEELADSGMHIPEELYERDELMSAQSLEQAENLGVSLIQKIGRHVESNWRFSEKVVIKKAKDYINGNYFKDIGLEEVADSVYLSSIYFSRLFKKQTHENFVAYLLKVRMNKAIELLDDPRLKFYEISGRVGYKNTKYFYKLFKEYTGFTPAEYREKALKGSSPRKESLP